MNHFYTIQFPYLAARIVTACRLWRVRVKLNANGEPDKL